MGLCECSNANLCMKAQIIKTFQKAKLCKGRSLKDTFIVARSPLLQRVGYYYDVAKLRVIRYRMRSSCNIYRVETRVEICSRNLNEIQSGITIGK